MIAFSVKNNAAGKEVTFRVTNDTEKPIIYILISLHKELVEGSGPLSPEFELEGRFMTAAKIINPKEALEFRLVYGKGRAKVEHYFDSEFVAATDFSEGQGVFV